MIIETKEELTQAWRELAETGVEPIITTGESMLPLLEPNHLILQLPLDVVRTGTVVSFFDPKDTSKQPRRIIKVLRSHIPENRDGVEGRLFMLEGTNRAASTDYTVFVPLGQESDVFKRVRRNPYTPISQNLIYQLIREGHTK